jgi:threonine-phosphate decarboxylase
MDKENNRVIHGGDLDIISRLYNIPKEEIISFSGNVNPLGVPNSVKEELRKCAELIGAYPDVDYVELKGAIAEYTGIDSKYILVGNGSTELITAFIKAAQAKRAVIVEPAYSEYKKALELTGSELISFPLKENEDFRLNVDRLIAAIDGGVDLLVMCNPNNPTGTGVSKADMKLILRHCLTTHTFVMVDETYVEFASREANISAMSLVPEYANLGVIRSTSKFFGCAGLRLGYAATSDKELAEYIAAHKDPWSVNIFAERCGIVMFKDKTFIEQSIDNTAKERARVKSELDKIKALKVYDTQSSFFLLRIMSEDITSHEVFTELIKSGLMIRDAADFPYLDSHYIRICLQSSQYNDTLIDKLKEILK